LNNPFGWRSRKKTNETDTQTAIYTELLLREKRFEKRYFDTAAKLEKKRDKGAYVV
jgi:hypothetical protein